MTVDIHHWGNVDRNPEATRQHVLHVLAKAKGSMVRREIQGQVFGDKFGASQTIQALRWLEDHRLAERLPSNSRRWRISEAGRLAVALDDEMGKAS